MGPCCPPMLKYIKILLKYSKILLKYVKILLKHIKILLKYIKISSGMSCEELGFGSERLML